MKRRTNFDVRGSFNSNCKVSWFAWVSLSSSMKVFSFWEAGTVQFYWDRICRELKGYFWKLVTGCLGDFLNLVLTHCLVTDIAMHLEKLSELSVGKEQSMKPDIDRGSVNFPPVLILLSFILVRELQNLWATPLRLTALWMASSYKVCRITLQQCCCPGFAFGTVVLPLQATNLRTPFGGLFLPFHF